ncbi:sulfoquinovosyl transferase SQD2 [Cucumis melo var. makuwa]|nr:sulfoquinovosyl transferase SQD2 [Cucumis melo var. makuwa]
MTSTSLSINLSLSPPPFSTSAAVATTTSFYEAPSSLRFPHFRSLASNPTSSFCEISRFTCLKSSFRSRGRGILSVKANKMTIAEVRPEDGEEDSPPLLDPETNSKPRRIALFVEPSPFA